jgi:hypothetical protein
MKWLRVLIMLFLGACSPPQTIRITFFGDSISVGYDDINGDQSTLDGFRPGTAANLVAKGYNANFIYVGNVLGANATPLTNKYEAVSGRTIQNITTALNANFGPAAVAEGLGVVGGCSNVTVGRFLLGTNNVVSDPASTTTNYTAMLTAFFAAFPNASASCAMIPPCRSDKGFAATIAQMNTDIDGVVATFVGAGHAVVRESAAGLVDADYASGGVHLIPSGNTKMAVVAANGIAAALLLNGTLH